jgi:hypothetical protein
MRAFSSRYNGSAKARQSAGLADRDHIGANLAAFTEMPPRSDCLKIARLFPSVAPLVRPGMQCQVRAIACRTVEAADMALRL